MTVRRGILRAIVFTSWLFLTSFLFFGVLGRTNSASAANSGTGQLFRAMGGWASPSVGDWVTRPGPTDVNQRFHRFYIEVPPSQAHLRVRIFDSDVCYGCDTDTGHYDQKGPPTYAHPVLCGASPAVCPNSYDETRCLYRLYAPDDTLHAEYVVGNTVDTSPPLYVNEFFLLRPDADGPGVDGDWDDDMFPVIDNPDAGHWRLEIWMRSPVDLDVNNRPQHDEINSFAISADDGDDSAAGTEFNVYTPWVPLSVADVQPVTLYPWVTSAAMRTPMIGTATIAPRSA